MINIVIALDCEAKPLIARFGLKRQQQHTYPLYTSEHINLIVSGIGKLNAATASGYLAGLTREPAAWLNIGIAGHKSHSLGTLYLAHKITNQQSQQNWYPAFTFKTGIATASLASFDVPVTEYADELLHDMEAAGFYQATCRFNSAEFIHCLKIVSDNAEHSTQKINKQMVSKLIHGQLTPIETFISTLNNQLERWNDITATPNIYNDILQRWHFSTYQQYHLKQLVKRWTTLNPQKMLSIEELASLKNSHRVLIHLQDALDI